MGSFKPALSFTHGIATFVELGLTAVAAWKMTIRPQHFHLMKG